MKQVISMHFKCVIHIYLINGFEIKAVYFKWNNAIKIMAMGTVFGDFSFLPANIKVAYLSIN